MEVLQKRKVLKQLTRARRTLWSWLRMKEFWACSMKRVSQTKSCQTVLYNCKNGKKLLHGECMVILLVASKLLLTKEAADHCLRYHPLRLAVNIEVNLYKCLRAQINFLFSWETLDVFLIDYQLDTGRTTEAAKGCTAAALSEEWMAISKIREISRATITILLLCYCSPAYNRSWKEQESRRACYYQAARGRWPV